MQRQVFMTEREVETVERKDEIVSGKTFLGIEFGSTRIQAVFPFMTAGCDRCMVCIGQYRLDTIGNKEKLQIVLKYVKIIVYPVFHNEKL